MSTSLLTPFIEPAPGDTDYIPPDATSEYRELPRAIRDRHSFEEYQWLGVEGRARLVQNETDPEF